MAKTTQDKERLRVHALVAENIKRLKAVAIPFGDGVTIISGKNRAGKSSVLDAIAMAIGGKKLCPPQPIRDGEDSAHTSVDLGSLQVTRTFTKAGGGSLKVTNREGQAFAKPQDVLDQLCDHMLAFDVLDFLRQQPKQQREQLLQLLGLGDKLAVIDSNRAELLATRRQLRDDEAVSAQEKMKYVNAFSADTPDTLVSSETLAADLRAARDTLEEYREIGRARDEAADAVARLDAEMDALAKQLDLKRKERERQQANADRHARAMTEQAKAGLPDVAAIEAKLGDLNTVNDAVRAKQAWKDAAKREMKTAASLAATGRSLKTCDAKRDALFTEAEWPVPGLGFDADGLTWNDRPLEQASQSEQLRVCMAIAMAHDPKLRMLRIKDGSLFDRDTLATLHDLAAEYDFQVLVEYVDDSGEIGIVIEDGEVKA